MEVGGKLRALAALTLRKEPLIPVEWRVRWVTVPFIDVLEKRKINFPTGNRTKIPRSSDPQFMQTVAFLLSLRCMSASDNLIPDRAVAKGQAGGGG